MDQETKNQIATEVQKILGQYKVPVHLHNGIDSIRIPAEMTMLPIQSVTTASTAPTDSPVNGTARIQYDSTHWYLWIRVNKLWKGVALA